MEIRESHTALARELGFSRPCNIDEIDVVSRAKVGTVLEEPFKGLGKESASYLNPYESRSLNCGTMLGILSDLTQRALLYIYDPTIDDYVLCEALQVGIIDFYERLTNPHVVGKITANGSMFFVDYRRDPITKQAVIRQELFDCTRRFPDFPNSDQITVGGTWDPAEAMLKALSSRIK